LEIPRTREKRVLTWISVQSGVVGVTVAKEFSVTVGVLVAVIGNTNVTKVWTPVGITTAEILIVLSDVRIVLTDVLSFVTSTAFPLSTEINGR
jgi:hypothetical protein